MAFVANVWVQWSNDGRPTNCHAIEFMINDNKVARVDRGLNVYKVDLSSTMETRLVGIDKFIEQNLDITKVLASPNAVVMNPWGGKQNG